VHRDSPIGLEAKLLAIETILVVDSRAHRKTLKDLLTTVGYQVVFASIESILSSGFSPQDHPVAILLPWHRGKMLPQAACRAIRQASFNVPLIVVGPRTQTGAKVKLLESGADDYIEEPFDNLELIARLRAAIRRSRLRALEAHQ
jgi:DNA-binding response OmpR family regulator